MGILLMIVGYGWAALGVANIFMMDWANISEAAGGFGLMFNGLLFILPGLVVGGIGSMIRGRSKPTTESN